MKKKRWIIIVTIIALIWLCLLFYRYKYINNSWLVEEYAEFIDEMPAPTYRTDKFWKLTTDPWFLYSEEIIRCPNWYVYNRIEYETGEIITDKIPEKIKPLLEIIEWDKWTERYCTWAYILNYNHYEIWDEPSLIRCTFDFEADNINCP